VTVGCDAMGGAAPSNRSPAPMTARHEWMVDARPHKEGSKDMRGLRTRQTERRGVITRNLEKRTGSGTRVAAPRDYGTNERRAAGAECRRVRVSFLEVVCRGCRTTSPGTRQSRTAPEHSRERGRPGARRRRVR
jgi:hypothetical protein